MQNNQILVIAYFISALFMVSCEQSFIPLQDNDRYFFSIHGYLDATADTQWVRVMPVRDELYFGADPIDARVTLKNFDSGESVVLNDSLFQYGQDGYAWNFWTTTKIEPEGTYQIRAERSDGKTSSATVTLPKDFPAPRVNKFNLGPGGFLDIVYLEGMDQLVDAQSIHKVVSRRGEKDMFTFSNLRDTSRSVDGLRFTIDHFAQNDYIDSSYPNNYSNPVFTYLHEQIFVAAGGPGFHFFPDIDERIIALPDGISNVENGLGYLAGIVSKTIPYKTCFNESGSIAPCPLEKKMRTTNSVIHDF